MSGPEICRRVLPGSGWLVALVLGAALLRLVPHPPNFTPVIAVALFAGTFPVPLPVALLVPVAAMLVSDAALELLAGTGFHSQILTIHGLVLLIAAGSRRFLRTPDSPAGVSSAAIAAAAITASLFFFAVSNLAVWLSGGLYPMTAGGLLACYLAALPFLGNTLAGTLFHAFLLFGLCRHVPYPGRTGPAGAYAPGK